MHAAADVPHLQQVGLPWRDNAFFAWWDDVNEVYGIVHVSTSPNGGGLRARCAVQVHGVEFEIVEGLPIGTFRSEHITVDLEGLVKCESQELTVELRMSPLFVVMDFTTNKSVPSLLEEFPLHHYQHGLRAEGSVTVRGVTQSFSGFGWRDRTWGYRDESAQWVEYIYANFVMQDCAVGLWKARGADGVERPFAWRVDDEGVRTLGEFAFSRDGSGLFNDATLDLGDGPVTFSKVRRNAGWWLPMGGRQTGPTFSAYDEYFTVTTPSGEVVGALGEHGILRRVVS